MTRHDAIAYLLADGNLSVPGGRYGFDTRSCAPIAWTVARIVARESGAVPNAARPWCKRPMLITWTGVNLGDITLGNTWRDNFGGTRQAIRVRAINGLTYSGTWYKSSGEYARLRAVKS